MNIIAGITPMMASSRFPGKALAKIHGIPLVGHVYFRSKMSESLDEVYVATCDQEIYEYVVSIGGKAIMTSDEHEMCTDRVAEAALKIEAELDRKLDIIVNIQGDQPMVFPDMNDAVVKPLIDDPLLMCATMVDKITSQKEFEDPNRIKVVTDKDG